MTDRKCPGYLRGSSSSSSYRLSMVELHEAPPSEPWPHLKEQQARHTWTLYFFSSASDISLYIFAHAYFKGSSCARRPAASLTLSRLFGAPYSVWINGHCLLVCVCGVLCCDSVSLHRCLYYINWFKASTAHILMAHTENDLKSFTDSLWAILLPKLIFLYTSDTAAARYFFMPRGNAVQQRYKIVEKIN